MLQNGGVAFDVKVPSAGTTDEINAAACRSSRSAGPRARTPPRAILAAQKDLVALARNIAQIRVGAEEMATLSQELTALMTQAGTPAAQVLRANRLTFLAERLGRGSAEILGSEMIDPEVPFLIGKDTNDLRSLVRALENGSEALAIAPVRDAEARAKLAELNKQFGLFEQNVGPILRELQKLVTARQAGAQLQAASEQLQGVGGAPAGRHPGRAPGRHAGRHARLRRAAAGGAASSPPSCSWPTRAGARRRPRARTSATRRRSCGC